jgi:hypothetical protein
MENALDTNEPEPFIAWSCSMFYNEVSPDFQMSCEKHIRHNLEQISQILGTPSVDGIILCDMLQRGMAVASLLTNEEKTLPLSGNGKTCDSHFDEGDLCSETNNFSLLARLNNGARGMLFSLDKNPDRRFIILDQRQASNLHPLGKKKNLNQFLATFGLLAHELAHAKDYAAGRPGLSSLEDLKDTFGVNRGASIHTIANMALAEYIATQEECRAQVAFHGACSSDLTCRAGNMAGQKLTLPDLDHSEDEGTEAHQQRHLDLSTFGYFIGTLAAYQEAKAPILGKDNQVSPDRTDHKVSRNLQKSSPLERLLKEVSPALKSAANMPNANSRNALAATLEKAIVGAQQEQNKSLLKKSRPSKSDDWGMEI